MKVAELYYIGKAGKLQIANDGSVVIPESYSNGSGIQQVDILEMTSTHFILILHAIKFKFNKLERTHNKHLVFLENGIINEIVTIIDPIPWMEKIKTVYDFVYNPNNKEVWQYLDPKLKPLYEGKHIFVDSRETVWVKSEFGWLPTDHNAPEFLESNNIHKTLRDEYLYYKNIVNLS